MQCYGSKKWRLSIHWKNFNPRDQLQVRISQISRCWTRKLLLLWTRSPRIPNSRRSVSRNRKPRKRTSSDEDYFRVTGAHAVLDYADSFSITLRDDNVQEFDTRWDEILLSMTNISSDDILERMDKLRIRESDQLKTVLELYDMEIHQKMSMPNYQKLKTMVKRSINQKLRLRNFRRQKRENWNRSQGIKWCWRRKRYLLLVERKRPVFERRPMQFLARK